VTGRTQECAGSEISAAAGGVDSVQQLVSSPTSREAAARDSDFNC